MMDPIEILERARCELMAEATAAGKRAHDLREWALPVHAAAICGHAQWRLNIAIGSSVAEYEQAVQFFSDRDARGEFETCGHCHTTNRQKGLLWGKCDVCGTMGVYPTQAEANRG